MSANPKRLSVAKGIVTNIQMSRMAGLLEGNIRKYAGGGTVAARGRRGDVDTWDVLP
jgi:hypothetical protein